MAAETVTVVIGVHSVAGRNTVPAFQECIRTLKEHTSNYRLVIVNDASDDEAANAINEAAYSVGLNSYVIKTYKQRWFTRSFNLGLRLVRTGSAVLLNSDTVLDSGWLEEMFTVKDLVQSEGKKVGIVGSTLSGEEPRRYAEKHNPGYVTGHCWLVSMQAMNEIANDRGTPGWFLDETQQRTIHIFSDNEACERMNKLGWATVESYKSAVGHHGGASWGHDLSVLHIRLQDVND